MAASKIKAELYNDAFQNWKRYAIPKAQLIIADIPYNVGKNAYGSSPIWWKDGNKENGASDKAGKSFFYSDGYFNLSEFMHFNSRMLIKEPKQTGMAPCLIVFCAYQQLAELQELGKANGLLNSRPLFFIKQTSPQVLKANMRICGATEFALMMWRGKLPKYRNEGKMHLDWMRWQTDHAPVVHPTQKPIPVLKQLIRLHTDPGDVVFDPTAGSGSTLRAAYELGRNSYGFEVNRANYQNALTLLAGAHAPSGESLNGAAHNLFDSLAA